MEIFDEKFIKTNIKVESKDDLLEKMTIDLFKNGIIRSKESFLKSIKERETILPTGIGHGIAIPHSRHHDVLQMKALIYILENELEYEAIDEKAVRIVIMLAIPPNHNHDYMMVLHTISTVLQEQYNRDKIINCKDTNEVYNILTSLHLDKIKH